MLIDNVVNAKLKIFLGSFELKYIHHPCLKSLHYRQNFNRHPPKLKVADGKAALTAQYAKRFIKR